MSVVPLATEARACVHVSTVSTLNGSVFSIQSKNNGLQGDMSLTFRQRYNLSFFDAVDDSSAGVAFRLVLGLFSSLSSSEDSERA